MPRISKIAPGQRRDWLLRYEQGESIEKIAEGANRDIRTVREHIDKARLERDFEGAQRDQLREALKSHQLDMLFLLESLRQAIQTPSLTPMDEVTGLDFGLEDLWEPSDLDRNLELALGPLLSVVRHGLDARPNAFGQQLAATIKVIRGAGGPTEIQITAEGSRLWRALKEHITKDPLWRHIAAWRNALLEELQARAGVNRAIRKKVEEVFGHRVGLRPAPQQPWLAPRLAWWLRARLTNVALGNHIRDVEEELRKTSTGGLETASGQPLADALGDTGNAIQQLRDTIAAMAGCDEVATAAQTHRDLHDKTERVHDALDEYLLIHHILGRCGLCKKLGGQ